MTNEERIIRQFTRPRTTAGRQVHTCDVCGTVDSPVAHGMANPGHEVTSTRVR